MVSLPLTLPLAPVAGLYVTGTEILLLAGTVSLGLATVKSAGGSHTTAKSPLAVKTFLKLT